MHANIYTNIYHFDSIAKYDKGLFGNPKKL